MKPLLGFQIPERATMSLSLKPLLPNKEISLSRPSLKLGRLVAAWLRPEVVESLLPRFTVHVGPLTYIFSYILGIFEWYVTVMVINNDKCVLTATDASRAATARMSAHDTIPGQMLSTSDLTSSMTSYPRTEFKLLGAFFSL